MTGLRDKRCRAMTTINEWRKNNQELKKGKERQRKKKRKGGEKQRNQASS